MASVINAIYRRHGERQKILVDPWFLFIFFYWNWNKKLWLAYVDIMIYQYPRLPQMAIFTSNFGQCLDSLNIYVVLDPELFYPSVHMSVCVCMSVCMLGVYTGKRMKVANWKIIKKKHILGSSSQKVFTKISKWSN